MTQTEFDWEAWQPNMFAVLMFIVKDGQVLLIEKLTGLGQGKVNAPGGKIEPGETAMQAAIRETQEEVCIAPINPIKRGELSFAIGGGPQLYCQVFMADDFTGEPKATREANPFWSAIDSIPFDRMWEDDQFWLPGLINGQTFSGKFVFEDEDTLISKELHFDVTLKS